jgi:RimJ/RimL family protein N-acetyltransferase
MATAVVIHTRANGLEIVELTTSELNRAALAVYEKRGWREERRVRYGATLVRVLRKKVG